MTTTALPPHAVTARKLIEGPIAREQPAAITLEDVGKWAESLGQLVTRPERVWVLGELEALSPNATAIERSVPAEYAGSYSEIVAIYRRTPLGIPESLRQRILKEEGPDILLSLEAHEQKMDSHP